MSRLLLVFALLLAFGKVKSWENDGWNWDGDDKHMSDGDHIVLTKDCDQGVDSESARFCLVASVTWWKAITVHAGQGHYLYELVAVQDSPGVKRCADVTHEALEMYDYVLSKAKTFGVHSDMYRISNIKDAPLGCAYTFEWLTD